MDSAQLKTASRRAGASYSRRPPLTRPSRNLGPLLRNPAAARGMKPADLLQLQRQAGNRAVCQFLQCAPMTGAAPARTGGGKDSAPLQSATEMPNAGISARISVQRKLDFDIADFPKPSSRAEDNESIYTQIHRELLAYKAIEVEGLIGAEKASAKQQRIFRLLAIRDKCEDWWNKYAGAITKGTKKKEAINRLRAAVRRELIFSSTFQGNLSDTFKADNPQWAELKESFGNALASSTGSSKFAPIREKRRELNRLLKLGDTDAADELWNSLSDTDQNLLKPFLLLKAERQAGGLGMTSKEVKALWAYTVAQYKLMNPSLAGDKKWLSGSMTRAGKDVNEAKISQAMLINNAISAVALQAINKLQPWQQGGTLIYRGESVSEKEFKELKLGFKRKFPHFVSTSRKESIANREARFNASQNAERSYVVLYVIKASTTGRDIAQFSESPDEVEILFPPSTVFKVTEVVKEDASTKYKKLEVEAI